MAEHIDHTPKHELNAPQGAADFGSHVSSTNKIALQRSTNSPDRTTTKKLSSAVNKGFIDFDKAAVNFFQCKQCGGEKKGCPVCQAQITKGATFKDKYVRKLQYFDGKPMEFKKLVENLIADPTKAQERLIKGC